MGGQVSCFIGSVDKKSRKVSLGLVLKKEDGWLPQYQNAPDFSRGMNGLFGAFGTGFRLENKEKPPALAGGGSQMMKNLSAGAP